jgi:hypothetical protein
MEYNTTSSTPYYEVTGTLVRFNFQDPQEGLWPIKTRDSRFGDKYEPWTFKEPQILARSTPPKYRGSKDIWSVLVHNPWEALNHEYLDFEACVVAQKHPGCLVFNTTVASLFVWIDDRDYNDDKNCIWHFYLWPERRLCWACYSGQEMDRIENQS